MGILETAISGQKRRNSHAAVVAELGRAIVAGEIPEGSILPGDQELSLRFGVSRTVLREAMKTLAAKSLIEAKAKVGTRVRERDGWNFFDPDVLGWRCDAGVDIAFVEHLAEVRLSLEPEAAAIVANRATSEEIVELYRIAARMDDPAHTRETIAEVDLEFHLAIARMTRNPFMRSVSSLIEAALSLSFQLSSPANSVELVSECANNHLKIVHAIASRDPDKARQAMRQVIQMGVVRINNVLK